MVQAECFSAELDALHKNADLPRGSKITRFNPFLEDGLIRLGGRLQCAGLSTDLHHPILLDGKHHFVHLLNWPTHIRLHHLGVRIILSELREEFWILRAHQAIKVLHRCLPCRMAKARPGHQIEAPLPADRVIPQKPFGVTGIDFAGPLYIEVGSNMRKGYIALLTCATTRAVHLELCTDMSDKFLLALQRFVGRRGLPHTVYTDNAHTFHATNKHLAQLWSSLFAAKTHQFFAQHICWKFIAPKAAWWGGWERMIGTTKRCLRKVLGRSQVSEEGKVRTLENSSENCEFNSEISNCGRQFMLSKLSVEQNSIKEIKALIDSNKNQTIVKPHGDEITSVAYDTFSSDNRTKSCEDCKELLSELKEAKQELSTYKEIITILQEEIRTIDTLYRDHTNKEFINKTMQNRVANENWTYPHPYQSKHPHPSMSNPHFSP